MTDLRIARRAVALLTLVMLTVVASLALATGPASADMVGLAEHASRPRRPIPAQASGRSATSSQVRVGFLTE